MKIPPTDHLSISRLAKSLAKTGISRDGMIAAARILRLRIIGDMIHLPAAVESEFFKEAELATQMFESQEKRVRRELQQTTE